MNSSLFLEFFLRLTRMFFTGLVLEVITAHIFALIITIDSFLFSLSNVFQV